MYADSAALEAVLLLLPSEIGGAYCPHSLQAEHCCDSNKEARYPSPGTVQSWMFEVAEAACKQ